MTETKARYAVMCAGCGQEWVWKPADVREVAVRLAVHAANGTACPSWHMSASLMESITFGEGASREQDGVLSIYGLRRCSADEYLPPTPTAPPPHPLDAAYAFPEFIRQAEELESELRLCRERNQWLEIQLEQRR